jgi:probable dihydroxyacetone kinase regulator
MTQMTKQAMAKALVALLEKKTLDKITVKEIVDLCGVNRQTFYYHFQDVYALLEWIFVNEAEKFVSAQQSIDTWQQDFLSIFDHLQKNKSFVTNAYRSIGRDSLEQYLYQAVYGFILDVVKKEAEKKKVPTEDVEFFADFYKYAFVGLVLEWVRTDMKEDPKELVARVARLFDRLVGRS